MLDAIENYQDSRGLAFVGMSASWKRLCESLPDSERVQIPPLYKTKWIDTQIHGEDVVIQVWKGSILDPFRGLPGGVGGEVGIYRRDPDRTIPRDLPVPALDEFPEAARPALKVIAETLIRDAVGWVEHGVDLWWPCKTVNAQIEMTLRNPRTGNVFFTADPGEPPGGYWMSRWMTFGSYAEYVVREHLHIPHQAHDYVMEFSVGDRRFRWSSPDSDIEVV